MADPKGNLVTPVGHRSDGSIHALELDNSDRLKVILDGITGIYGWISNAWRKAPLPFGVSGSVARAWQNLAVPAGPSNQDDSAVPAGEVWVITNTTLQNDNGAAAGIRFQIVSGAVSATLFQINTPAASVVYDRQGWWVLMPGDLLRLAVSGGVLNSDVYGAAYGFRIDIDQ